VSFIVSQDCIELGLRAGAILFRNVRVCPASADLRAEIAQEILVLRTKFTRPEAIRSTPEVIAFREILRNAGSNPRKDQPSVERLLTFALKRGDLPAINNLVDAYNLVSIRTRCSLGAHDFDTLVPPVALRLLTGKESFTPLGGGKETVLMAGEYGYVDAHDRVLCRLDVLQADFSKVTPATVNALLIIEGTSAHAEATFQHAFAEAIERVTRHCGGTAEVICFPHILPV
jgi:DNA/RNA-binding domain of Phe-tRNA-synthetase-like protein